MKDSNYRKCFFLSWVCLYQVSLVCVISTNHVNWHRETLQSDGKKTGFENEI